VKQIGIDKRCQDHQKNNGQEDPNAAKETCQHDGKAANYPKTTGKPVGSVPVFFIIQCPGDLYADGVILLAFRQVIADDRKQKSHQYRHHHFYPHFFSQCHCISDRVQHRRQHRNDPKHQMHNLFGVVILFGIRAGTQCAQPLSRQ